MSFFGWLGNLFNQLVDWLGRAFSTFIEKLVNAFSYLWRTISESLYEIYGFVNYFYVIFYQNYGKVMMELWDPKQINKPSHVFDIKEAPQGVPLPPIRGDAKVLTLTSSQ